jgi:hypothetical protein
VPPIAILFILSTKKTIFYRYVPRQTLYLINGRVLFFPILSNLVRLKQCCGSETFHYRSGSDFSLSSGPGSYFTKVPVSHPTFLLKKYDFKGPKMAFQNIIFKEYLNLVYKNGPNYEITPVLMVFDDVSIHFRIWTRIKNPRVTDPDPAKVSDPCGSGSTTLDNRIYHFTWAESCPEQSCASIEYITLPGRSLVLSNLVRV